VLKHACFIDYSRDSVKHPYLKELENSILEEISDFWKEASQDVAFYAKETVVHRFTKVLYVAYLSFVV